MVAFISSPIDTLLQGATRARAPGRTCTAVPTLPCKPNSRCDLRETKLAPNTRWGSRSRDPIGYADGENLYKSYLSLWMLDPNGTSCSIQPCLDNCKKFHLAVRRRLCEDSCRTTQQKFLDWYDGEVRKGVPNFTNLPQCPCSIKCDEACFYMLNGKPGYHNICAPKGWSLGSPFFYPTYLPVLHPGAVWDLRSDGGPPRTQCTYDANGNLITNGPGIGTVDTEELPGHYRKDVVPANYAIELNGGTLGGCWFNMYKRMRPLMNGNKCSRNP